MQRALSAAVAVVAVAIAAVLGLRDLRFEDRTCGSALLATDASKVVVLTGDPSIDDFEASRLSGSCGRLVQRRRFLVVVPLAIAGGALYLYLRRPPDRSPWG